MRAQGALVVRAGRKSRALGLPQGVPTPVDVPIDRTFENRATYDRALVDAAIKALGSYQGG